LHCNNQLIDYATAAAVADEIGIVMAAAIIIPPPPLLPLPCLMKKIYVLMMMMMQVVNDTDKQAYDHCHQSFMMFFPLDSLQVLIMDEVTVKVMSCTCNMADITDEGISCESSSLFFFFLSVCLSLLASCLALLQIPFFLLHFLRLLATIIETKP
jgi:hypothetical protein